MSALEAVLQMKQQEREAQKAQSDSILMATQLFQASRQQATANQMAQLEMAQKSKLVDAQIKNYEADATKNAQSNEILNKALTGELNSGGFKPKSINIGGVTLEDSNISDLKSQREERLVKQQQFSNSTKLRQEFINRPEVKDYITVSPNIKAMDSLLSKGLSGDVQNMVALDQGLITMFNKLTDPQSVVRESEYARTPQNLPFVNQFQGAIQKIQAGGAGMTNDDRKALVQGAKIIANERGGQYQKTLDEYKGTAADYGLDEKLITRDMPNFKEFKTGKEDIGNKNNSLEVGKSITINGKIIKRID